jgi:hypothetical protein
MRLFVSVRREEFGKGADGNVVGRLVIEIPRARPHELHDIKLASKIAEATAASACR